MNPPLLFLAKGPRHKTDMPWGMAATVGSWARWHSVLVLYPGHREAKLGIREDERRAQGHSVRGGRELGLVHRGSKPGTYPSKDTFDK